MMTSPPLRICVLCSRRAPALRHLLQHDVRRGVTYEIVACLTSEEICADEELITARDIPFLRHPIRRFCSANGWPLSDRTARTTYDAMTVRRLSARPVDLVLLDSYLYRLSEPMLSAYRGRILNIHHSDLLDRDARGAPRFPGLKAVRDAIRAGVRETRATTHLVTEEIDEGPPLVRSWPFAVAPLVGSALSWGAADMLNAYAYAHQEWMIRATWGPLAAATIQLIADGRLDLAAVTGSANGAPGVPFELQQNGSVRPLTRWSMTRAQFHVAAG